MNLTTRIVLVRIKLLCLSRSTQSKSTKSVHLTMPGKHLNVKTKPLTLENQIQLLALPTKVVQVQTVRTTKKKQRNGAKVLLLIRYLKVDQQKVRKGANWAHSLLWQFQEASKLSLKWSGPSRRITNNL